MTAPPCRAIAPRWFGAQDVPPESDDDDGVDMPDQEEGVIGEDEVRAVGRIVGPRSSDRFWPSVGRLLVARAWPGVSSVGRAGDVGTRERIE